MLVNIADILHETNGFASASQVSEPQRCSNMLRQLEQLQSFVPDQNNVVCGYAPYSKDTSSWALDIQKGSSRPLASARVDWNSRLCNDFMAEHGLILWLPSGIPGRGPPSGDAIFHDKSPCAEELSATDYLQIFQGCPQDACMPY